MASAKGSGKENKKTKDSAAKKTSSSKKSSSVRASKTASSKKASAYTGTGGKKNTSSEFSGSGISRDIMIVVMLAASLIILISLFGSAGVVGGGIRVLIFGLFGAAGFLFPFILFFGFSFYLANEKNYLITRKMVGLILLFVFICAFFHLMFLGYEKEAEVLSYFSSCAETHTGGGLLGGALIALFGLAFGMIGAYLLTLTGIAISLIVLTQKPLISNMHSRNKRAALRAKERREALKEEQMNQMMEDDLLIEDDREKRASKEKSVFKLPDFGKKNAEKNENAIPAEEKKKPLPVTEKVSAQENLSGILKKSSAEDIKTTKEDKSKSSLDALREMIRKSNTNQKNSQNTHLNDPANDKIIQSTSDENINSDAANGNLTQNEDDLPARTRHVRPRSSQEEINENVESIRSEVMKDEESAKPPYQLPSLDLLTPGKVARGDSEDAVINTATKLQQTFEDFGVKVKVVNVSQGPTVTRYELQPDHGVKVQRILSLSDDIKLNLAAADIRIEAPVPGKSVVGIEVPNKEPGSVMLREMLETDEFRKFNKPLAFAVGKDIGGNPIITDIAKMPHLLIAGATGSGKSVCINTLIMSILYKSTPEEVRMIMIDPKVVELKIYEGIPHLLIPVVTDAKKASGALNWAVAEMTERYNKFASMNGVRDIDSYNKRVEEINANPDVPEEEKLKKLPRIVVIVDELADLMMVAPGEVEDAICRLAQLARAAGIHVIIATQRPSVNVVTGLIKANMPSRIALAVTSGVDSRTILDMNGAEKLLGKGDMLFSPQQYPTPVRVQGCYVSDEEITRVVKFLTDQSPEVVYNEETIKKIDESANRTGAKMDGSSDGRDEYFWDAGSLIIDKDKASIGMLQRYFKIGFNRAARIMDQLAEAGIVGEEEGTKPRTILMSAEQFENMKEQGY